MSEEKILNDMKDITQITSVMQRASAARQSMQQPQRGVDEQELAEKEKYIIAELMKRLKAKNGREAKGKTRNKKRRTKKFKRCKRKCIKSKKKNCIKKCLSKRTKRRR